MYISVSTGKYPVSTGKFPVSTLVGVFVGTLLCVLHRQSLNLRGHFRGRLRVHSRVHFREHFRERARGSKFSVRVLCAFLTEDYCKKVPCKFNTEIFVSQVGNPCPTLGQLLGSQILYSLLVGGTQHEIGRARFSTQSCSKVGQLLVNSSPTPHPMGSCRGLPCNSPLATLAFIHSFFFPQRER